MMVKTNSTHRHSGMIQTLVRSAKRARDPKMATN